jgi:hypothetical protein
VPLFNNTRFFYDEPHSDALISGGLCNPPANKIIYWWQTMGIVLVMCAILYVGRKPNQKIPYAFEPTKLEN